MQTRLSNKYNAYSKAIAYNIIGSYARGAAYESATLSSKLTNKELGKRICRYNRAEGECANPLHIKNDVNDNYLNVEGINYLNNLLAYGNDRITDTFNSLNQAGLSESVKLTKLQDEAQRLSRELGKVAFGEGMMDDELKMDIQLILKEGKERFEERTKEVVAQDAVPVEEVEAPQEQMQDPNIMQGDNDAFGGFDDNQEDIFGDDANPQDLGFDDGFGEPLDTDNTLKTDKNDIFNNAANELNQFANDKNPMDEINGKQGESFLLSDIDENKVALGEAYNYHGSMTKMNYRTIDRIVEEVLDFEKSMFETVASAEGVNAINSDDYMAKSKYAVNELVVILTVRERLNI